MTQSQTITTPNWNDATVFGDLGSPEASAVLAQTVIVLCGNSKHQETGTWGPWPATVKRLIDRYLSRHKESLSKDGKAIVFADSIEPANGERKTVGENVIVLRDRKRDSITSVAFAGYDIDGGESLDDALDRLQELGIFSIVYTTFSHGKQKSEILRSAVNGEWTPDGVIAKAHDIGLVKPHIIELDGGTKDDKPFAVVGHEPIDKFRILFPLETPFQLNPGNRTKHKKLCDEWRGRLLGFAKERLGIKIDETGCDVNRLLYTPRHPAKCDDWFTGIIAGRALKIDEMPLCESDRPRQGQSRSINGGKTFTGSPDAVRPVLSDGFDLKRWVMQFGDRFLATDFIDELGWEFRRGGAGDDDAVIECPNDAAHSNAGDQHDQACWVKIGDGDGKFVIKCQHHSCNGLGKLEMLVALEQAIDLPDGIEHMSELICLDENYADAPDGEPQAPVRAHFLNEASCDAAVFDDGEPHAPVRAHFLNEAPCDAAVIDDGEPTPESIEAACEEALKKTSYSIEDGQVCFSMKIGKDWVDLPMCAPFEVVGRTYSESNDGYGIVIRFAADQNSRPVREVTVSRAELVANGGKVIAYLADKGFWVTADKTAKENLAVLLSEIKIDRDIVTYSRPGWHDGVFVSPTGEVFSNGDGHIARLSEKAKLTNPTPAGTLDGWKRATSAALNCPNGDFLCIGLLSGFAGCILDLMGEVTSLILNFAGNTSRGKTTAQREGASVWANPGRGGLLVKFNTTDNAIEGIAQRASGTLLALDEGGQSGMDGGRYEKAIYNLAEGSGKIRMTSSADMRDVRSWTTCISISEEIGFADKVKRDGRKAAAGAVARCWEIDVDDAVTLDLETIRAIDEVKMNYGHAGPVFVRYLLDSGIAADVDGLRVRVKAAERELSPNLDAPQRRRVAGAAAVLQVAGELAQEAGLIPSEYMVEAAVRRVFERSAQRMAQDMDPIETALATFVDTVVSRLGVDIHHIDIAESDAERLNKAIVGWFGYRDSSDRIVSNSKDMQHRDRVYIFPQEQLGKLAGGNVSSRNLAKVLKDRGYLIPANKKNSVWPGAPGNRKIKNYRVSGSFFHSEQEDEGGAGE